MSRMGNEKNSWTKLNQQLKKNPTILQEKSRLPSRILQEYTVPKRSRNTLFHSFFCLQTYPNSFKLIKDDRKRSKTLETLRKKSKTIKKIENDQKWSEWSKTIKDLEKRSKVIKSDQKIRKTIKNFLNFHFPKKWPRTISNHSE